MKVAASFLFGFYRFPATFFLITPFFLLLPLMGTVALTPFRSLPSVSRVKLGEVLTTAGRVSSAFHCFTILCMPSFLFFFVLNSIDFCRFQFPFDPNKTNPTSGGWSM